MKRFFFQDPQIQKTHISAYEIRTMYVLKYVG